MTKPFINQLRSYNEYNETQSKSQISNNSFN
jgi:hypothetical protein